MSDKAEEEDPFGFRLLHRDGTGLREMFGDDGLMLATLLTMHAPAKGANHEKVRQGNCVYGARQPQGNAVSITRL